MSRHIKPPCSQTELQQLLEYDSNSGIVIWRIRRSRMQAGSKAGKIKIDGTGRRNRYLRINGKDYKESHIVWYYMTGEWPSMVIDHIDRDTENNRFDNLRHVSQSDNLRNRRKYKKGIKV